MEWYFLLLIVFPGLIPIGCLWVRFTPTRNKYQVIKGRRWEEWYAWHPVTDIHGQRHWRTRVYRTVANTYADCEDYTKYHYGNLFDVLESS